MNQAQRAASRFFSYAASAGSKLCALLRLIHPQRHDELGREQGQATLRVVITAGVFLYLVIHPPTTSLGAGVPAWFVCSITYLALSLIVLALALHDTSSSVMRRTIMNAGDATIISYLMIVTGATGIPLFVLYLWITLGNGFRFGLRAMGVSVVLCLIGFAGVVAMTPIWLANISFAAAVFLALLVLPLYASHLIAMLHRAQAKIANGEFLARISQELQTPLKNIVGAAELLESNQRLTPDERSLLGVILDSVRTSLRQIENVLDFSRLDGGKLLLEPTACDLHEIVNAVAEMVRPTAMRKGLRLLTRIEPQTPYRLICDVRHLRNVLLHLLSDAIKRSANGLVSIDVSGRIDSGRRATVRIEVRDPSNGVGAPRIVGGQRRETGEAAGTDSGELGITIAQQLVELMGGRIGVDDDRGKGRRTWLEVSVAAQPATPDVDLKLSGIRAMLVSQDAVAINHFQQALTQLQGQLIPTAAEKEALEVLTRAIRLGNPVHVLLIDAELALTSEGAHRFAELCDKGFSANVPAILVSDFAPPADRLRQFGYRAVLSRRATVPHLFAALHAIPLWQIAANQGVVTVAPWLWSRREAKRPRILVADDNRTNLMIVRRMLEHAGYEVDDEATGKDALDRLCAGNYRLAILDIHMPDMSGISVLRQYRLRRPRSRLPTIILTANVSLDAQQQSADAGADAYLAKPVTTADLLNEVERLIREPEIATLSPAARSVDNDTAKNEMVLQIDVLAELDRLYQNPRGLAQVIEGYHHEGKDLLEKIEQECRANNHAAFSEWIRALKSNAANMGAIKLIRACNEIETIGPIEFRRENLQLLARLKDAFTESLHALHELVRDAQPSSSPPGD
jgi:two-component system sensor histidine kinase RpfC